MPDRHMTPGEEDRRRKDIEDSYARHIERCRRLYDDAVARECRPTVVNGRVTHPRNADLFHKQEETEIRALQEQRERALSEFDAKARGGSFSCETGRS